jgi:hypothetical protein
MNNGSAKIVSLADLMSDNIGGDSTNELDKSTEELERAIRAEEPDMNFFNLSEAKKKSEQTFDLEDDSDDSDTIKSPIEKSAGSIIASQLGNSVEALNSKDDYKFSSASSDIYKNTLKSMFGESIDVLVQEDEEGNEVEVSLEEVEIDEDTFREIVKSKLDEIKEEASRDKISVKGISDFTRDLIEIDRNGGDINELIKVKESFSDPLDELDLSTEEGQIKAIYLRMLAGGQDEDTIRRLIKSYKLDGDLEEVANKAEQELRGAMQQQVERAKQLAIENSEKRKSLLKSYKKDIKDNLSDFELNENIKNKIVQLATKEDENGRFEIDRIYYSYREDPKKAARLALFLLDEDEFINQVTNQAVKNTKLNTAKKLKIVTGSARSTSGPTLKENTNRFGGDGLIPLETIASAK